MATTVWTGQAPGGITHHYVLIDFLPAGMTQGYIRNVVENQNAIAYLGNFEALVRFDTPDDFQTAIAVLLANRDAAGPVGHKRRIKQQMARWFGRLEPTVWPPLRYRDQPNQPHHIIIRLEGFGIRDGGVADVRAFVLLHLPPLVFRGLTSVFVPFQPHVESRVAFVGFDNQTRGGQATGFLHGRT